MEAGSTPPASPQGSRRGLLWVVIVAVVVLALAAVAAVLFLWPGEEERVTVPDVVGLSTGSAERVLEAAGLTLGEVEYVTVDAESAEVDTVLSQAPHAGSKVETGSQVALVVAEAAEEEGEETTPAPAGSDGSGSEDAPETEPEAGPESDGDVHFEEPEPEPEPTWHTVAADSGTGDHYGPWFTTTATQLQAIVVVSSASGRGFVFDIYYEETIGGFRRLGTVAGTPTPTRHVLGVIDTGETNRWRMKVNALGDDGEWSYEVQEWR